MANKRFRGGPIIGQMELWIISVVLGSSLLARSTRGADKEIIKAPPPQEKTEHTARAIFQMSMEQPSLLGPSRRYNEQEYGIFRNTQKELLLSRMVLRSALHDAKINQLPIVKRQKDPVDWLAKNLSVTFPGKAEIMEVVFTAPEAKDAAAIVNAVADAYMQNVVDVEQRQRVRRLDELDRVYQEATSEVRNLRSRIRNLADRFGGAASEAYAMRQRLMLDELSGARRRLAQMEGESERFRTKVAVQRALAKNMRNHKITEIECLKYAAVDPLLRRLGDAYATLYMQKESQTEGVKSDTKNPLAKEYLNRLEQAKKQYQDRITHIREEIRDQRIDEMRDQLKTWEISLEQVAKQQVKLEKKIDQLREQAEQLGRTSVELEMYRSDLKNREETLGALTAEREKIRAELRAPSRITLLQKAEPPE